MSALHVMFFADRIKDVTVHSNVDRDGKAVAYVEIASRCSEAAALLEAAAQKAAALPQAADR